MRVLVTDSEFADLSLEQAILEEAGLEVAFGQCRTAEDVISAGHGVQALLVQYAPITSSVFDELSSLKIVSRYGVGVDNIDLEAAARHDVWVANVPDYGVEEVSAHTVAMLLGITRHIPFHDRFVRQGGWNYRETGQIQRLSSMTLGLIGFGRIGRTVAEKAGPWFQRVLAYDPYRPADTWPQNVTSLSLEEVVTASHALSLHLPLTEATEGLVGDGLLALMPEAGAYLVNTARGGLVDLDALLRALDSGRVRAAALDVLPQEPPSVGHAILQHPRIALTPHAAWYSEESEADLRRRTAENVVEWLNTGRPRSTRGHHRADLTSESKIRGSR